MEISLQKRHESALHAKDQFVKKFDEEVDGSQVSGEGVRYQAKDVRRRRALSAGGTSLNLLSQRALQVKHLMM
jgi:acetoacetate decarboxylase